MGSSEEYTLIEKQSATCLEGDDGMPPSQEAILGSHQLSSSLQASLALPENVLSRIMQPSTLNVGMWENVAFETSRVSVKVFRVFIVLLFFCDLSCILVHKIDDYKGSLWLITVLFSDCLKF